ncbi:MAG TPA: CvpA family protein [Anaeromyxobacteraceae bacterium]|nr:CvpA family protein [Anaeromyxobacteraceae bacterium]
MTLDAVVIALLALSAVLGAIAGAMRPLFLAGGAGLGWLSARHLSLPLGGLLERFLPAPFGRALAASLLFCAGAALGFLLGRRLSLRPGGGRRPSDRAAGALLGGAAGALAAWVALAALDAASTLLPRGLESQLAQSDLAALVREHDLLGRWRRPAEEALRELLRLASDPAGLARLERDPDLRGLADDERVREIVDEAKLPGRGDPGGSSRALKLLADPDFRERLLRAEQRLRRESPGG